MFNDTFWTVPHKYRSIRSIDNIYQTAFAKGNAVFSTGRGAKDPKSDRTCIWSAFDDKTTTSNIQHDFRRKPECNADDERTDESVCTPLIWPDSKHIFFGYRPRSHSGLPVLPLRLLLVPELRRAHPPLRRHGKLLRGGLWAQVLQVGQIMVFSTAC